MQVPDVPGVLVGWRTWEVNWAGTIMSRTRWPQGGPLVAECGLRFHRHEAPVPVPECMSGIYAVREPLHLIRQPGAASWSSIENGLAIAGKVALWGKVIEHEKGWRAQYAKPLALALPPEPDERMLIAQERYDLPSTPDEGLYKAMKKSLDEEATHGLHAAHAFRSLGGSISNSLGGSSADVQAALDTLAVALGGGEHEPGALDTPAKEAAQRPMPGTRKPSYTALNPNEPRNTLFARQLRRSQHGKHEDHVHAKWRNI